MKLDHLLSRLALAGLITFGFGLALDIVPLALFSVTASALILLIGAADYRPRYHYASRTTVTLRRREVMPLAA